MRFLKKFVSEPWVLVRRKNMTTEQKEYCVPFTGDITFMKILPKSINTNDHYGYITKLYFVPLHTCTNSILPINAWNKYIINNNDDAFLNIDCHCGYKYLFYDYKNGKTLSVPLNEDDFFSTDFYNIDNVSVYALLYMIYNAYKIIIERKEFLINTIKSFTSINSLEDVSYKDTIDKPNLSLVPQQILYDIAEVREYGNKKYSNGGINNWKDVPVEDYINALYRHLTKMINSGFNSKDSESGIEHYKHIACNSAFICDLLKDKKE